MEYSTETLSSVTGSEPVAKQYSSAMYAYLALKMLEQLDFDEESSSDDEFYDYVVASKKRRTDSEYSEDRHLLRIQELQDYGVTTSSAPSSITRITLAAGKTDSNETKNGDASRLNYDQQECMVKYLENNPDLAKGRARTRVGIQRTKDEWTELAAELNKIEGGVVKTGKGWAKYWSNKKCTLFKNRDKLVTSHRACAEADDIPSFDIRLLAVLGCLDGNNQVLEPKEIGPQEEGGIKLLSLQPPPPPGPGSQALTAGPSSAPPLPVACDDNLAEIPPSPSPALEVKPLPQNDANIADQKEIKPKESGCSALYRSFEKMEELANKIKTHFDSAIKAWNSDRRTMKKLLNEQQKNIMEIRKSLNNGRI